MAEDNQSTSGSQIATVFTAELDDWCLGLWHALLSRDGLFTASPPAGNAPEKSRCTGEFTLSSGSSLQSVYGMSFILAFIIHVR